MIKARKHGGSQGKINRIVIHCTVSPCAPGWAVKIARYFQSPSAGGSAHYVVDPSDIVQCLPDSIIAYHAPPNTGSIGVELCDWQKGNASRWRDDNHDRMLRRAAPLVRSLANKYSIPLVWLTPAQLRAGQRGICGHVDVSHAWGQTDHGDPNMGGAFPKSYFMELVRGSNAKPPAKEKNWTEEMVKKLPMLKQGADNYDVKSVRAAAFSRGVVRESVYSDVGLKAWLENTKWDPELTGVVKAFQKAEKIDADGIVGPDTWAILWRVN